MAKLRIVRALHPDSTATVTSLSKGTKVKKNPTGKLWVAGVCKVVGEEALPLDLPNDVKVIKG